MRTLTLGLALLIAAAPALACVCAPPETEEAKREMAARIANSAIAVVEVEQIAGMDFDAMRGETYRVVQVHLGQAPAQFELERGFSRGPDGRVQLGMTSCDEIPPPGRRTTVALYAASGSPDRFRIGGTCDHLFVNMPGAVDRIRAEWRATGSERG